MAKAFPSGYVITLRTQAIFIAPGFQQDTENRYDPEQCCFQSVLKPFKAVRAQLLCPTLAWRQKGKELPFTLIPLYLNFKRLAGSLAFCADKQIQFFPTLPFC